MTDYEEEQRDEIEALESIYPDSFTSVSDKPHCFSISVGTEEGADEDDVESFSVTLQFTYTQKYPEEAPIFEVVGLDGFEDDGYEEKLNNIINDQIEENLGMAMIFTIVSAVQEHLNVMKDDILERIKHEAERKEREEKEADEKKCRGTPVTVANFLAWKSKFDEEMAEIEKQKMQNEKKTSKLSGKEVFQQMKVEIDDAELLEGEQEAVEVDESLFEDLDDLELDDDEDFEET
ncbi:RWD domain-containing protein 1-like [Clavelina lepadiformis]|uniref:RWD domain-containing protein n=1 Tax=Clavelina lepadiformis TaxID=159417 RepID=A0ABP0FKG7_CLALP